MSDQNSADSVRSLVIGHVQRPARGEQVCGDAFVIKQHSMQTIIGIADGLGHGPLAAEASTAFCDYVAANPQEELCDIIHASHALLRTTRGAAAAVIRIDMQDNTLKFVGIGNVELRSSSGCPIKPISYPRRPGPSGAQIQRVRIPGTSG